MTVDDNSHVLAKCYELLPSGRRFHVPNKTKFCSAVNIVSEPINQFTRQRRVCVCVRACVRACVCVCDECHRTSLVTNAIEHRLSRMPQNIACHECHGARRGRSEQSPTGTWTTSTSVPGTNLYTAYLPLPGTNLHTAYLPLPGSPTESSATASFGKSVLLEKSRKTIGSSASSRTCTDVIQRSVWKGHENVKAAT